MGGQHIRWVKMECDLHLPLCMSQSLTHSVKAWSSEWESGDYPNIQPGQEVHRRLSDLVLSRNLHIFTKRLVPNGVSTTVQWHQTLSNFAKLWNIPTGNFRKLLIWIKIWGWSRLHINAVIRPFAVFPMFPTNYKVINL